MVGTSSLAQPCFGLWRGGQGPWGLCSLLGTVFPASSALRLASGSWRRPRSLVLLAPTPLRCPLWEAGGTAVARAQLRTLGGLEDLRGFPRQQPLASSLLPAGGLCYACPLPGLRAALAEWQEGEWAPAQGHGTAPGAATPSDQLPGKASRRLGAAPVEGGSPSGPLTGGPVGTQPCVFCHLGVRHC